MTSYKGFLTGLTPFDDFFHVADDKYFQLVPQEWGLILTDVKGSTKAVQGGRHREVNMVGAACITAILNELGDRDLPFVFGGDGATILIPPNSKDAACTAMKKVQAWSEKEFNLELRSSYFELQEVYREGPQLLLGKYQLSPGNFIYQFRGGALKTAEEKMKKETGGFKLTPSVEEPAPNLEGLSCRWEPLSAVKGSILTILVDALGAETQAFQIYQNLLKSLRNILGGDFKYASPVQHQNLKVKWPPKTLMIEVRSGTNSLIAEVCKAAWASLIAYLFFKFNICAGGFNPERYRQEMISNSDFQKYDDLLRMVLDCSDQQALAIEKVLAEFESRGEIQFGTHHSSQALMTCLVFSATQNQHLHFIDGAQGGYTLAAVSLKNKLRSL